MLLRFLLKGGKFRLDTGGPKLDPCGTPKPKYIWNMKKLWKWHLVLFYLVANKIVSFVWMGIYYLVSIKFDTISNFCF